MKNIVLIEDNEVLQFLLRKVLKNAGYSVLSVMDGEEILNNNDILKCDLIILDMMIPHAYDSRELINVYKNQKVPKIVMSSIDLEDGKYFAKSIGAEMFINKPFEPQMLLDEVNSIFKQQ